MSTVSEVLSRTITISSQLLLEVAAQLTSHFVALDPARRSSAVSEKHPFKPSSLVVGELLEFDGVKFHTQFHPLSIGKLQVEGDPHWFVYCPCPILVHSLVEAYLFATRREPVDPVRFYSWVDQDTCASYISSRQSRTRIYRELCVLLHTHSGDVDYTTVNSRFATFLSLLDSHTNWYRRHLEEEHSKAVARQQENQAAITATLIRQQEERDQSIVAITQQWNRYGLAISPSKAAVLHFINWFDLPALHRLLVSAPTTTSLTLNSLTPSISSTSSSSSHSLFNQQFLLVTTNSNPRFIYVFLSPSRHISTATALTDLEIEQQFKSK